MKKNRDTAPILSGSCAVLWLVNLVRSIRNEWDLRAVYQQTVHKSAPVSALEVTLTSLRAVLNGVAFVLALVHHRRKAK